MDANRMVQYAKNWTSVPEQVTCEVYLNTSGLVTMSCVSSILYFTTLKLTTKSLSMLRGPVCLKVPLAFPRN